MTTGKLLLSIAVMAGATYLVRMLPMVLCKGKIHNRFILSFLQYIPYAVLGAMTFPAILYSTGGLWSALAGLGVAALLAWWERDLLLVAVSACGAVFLTEWIQRLIAV